MQERGLELRATRSTETIRRYAWLLGVLAVGCFACHRNRQVELPAPTGPYAIGRITLRFQDESRPESMTAAPNDVREVVVQLWYPAAIDAASVQADYVPQLDALRPVLDQRSLSAFELVRIHTREAASPADGSERFPVLVFSHGNDMLTAEYAFLIEELVSRGFVVAALDHPYDARAALLANGKAVGFAADRWPTLPPPDPSGKPDPDSAFAQFYRARVDVRAADTRFVLDQLSMLDSPPLAKLLVD